MMIWSDRAFTIRALALLLESLLQMLLRSTASLLGTIRGAIRNPDKASFRGRLCHCSADLPLHLLHSEGIREGCAIVVDYGSNVQRHDRKPFPVTALRRIASEISAGETVHVKTDNLEALVDEVLPFITGPITLVTGDSDAGCVRQFEHLLNHPSIAHWFVQNCDVTYRHPRLTRIPIGLDNPVFTKLEKRLGFLLTMLLGKTPLDFSFRRNDMGDQSLLQRIKRESMRPNREKNARALCTFHNNQKLVAPDLTDLPDRHAAFEELQDNPVCDFMPRRLPQEDYWRIHDRYAFEVCPAGNGLDCFRTWECLFLETIPIVKTSTLDPLYQDEGFPVVIVETFREITMERLRQWQEEKQALFTEDMHYRLTNDYWLDKINGSYPR